MIRSILYTLMFLVISFSSPILSGKEISVMSFNVENLFDNKDDPNKNDETYLPKSMKLSKNHIDGCNTISVTKWRDDCLNIDWTDEAINYKISVIVAAITSYGESGPDIIGFQEVENIRILEILFNQLKPKGYKYFSLDEGNDFRGIDNAFISKYEIIEKTLHPIVFSGGSDKQIGDTRGIYEGQFLVDDQIISIYNVHFPAPHNPLFMRVDAFKTLNELSKKNDKTSIALGDFNVTSREESQENLYKSFSKDWYISHIDECVGCKGTSYYFRDKTWSFLDSIMIRKKRSANFKESSVKIVNHPLQTREDGTPIRFDSYKLIGISDHFPVVAIIELN